MQGKSLYAILLSIIAVLALALAVLVIFLFTTYNNINKQPVAATTPIPTSTAPREVPAAEQVKFNLYASGEGAGGDAVFNLKPSPAHDSSFLMASITIVFDAGPKSKNLEERTALLNNSSSEMKEACIEYFRGLTYEDATADAAMQKARDALKDSFNNILSSETKDQVIIKIVIDKWNIQ